MGPSGQEAWEKAAACEAHARNTKDEKLQRRFRQLRDSWIRIANNAQFAADAVASAERLQYEKGS